MKWCILVVAVFGIFRISFGRAVPSHNGMVFYQSAPMYYSTGSQALGPRMMYVQYVKPQQPGDNSNSVGGVSAFASGDTIATNTYLKDTQSISQDTSEEKLFFDQQQKIQYDETGTTSIAEAYPEQDVTDHTNAEDEFENDLTKVIPGAPDENTEIQPENVVQRKGKSPQEYVPPELPIQTDNYDLENVQGNVGTEDDSNGLVKPVKNFNNIHQTIPQSAPAAYIPPRKKIRVELEAPINHEEDDDVLFAPKKQKPSQGKPEKFPTGTFFPIEFGGTSGGAIAIANSFSTGDGASVTSHATAYGSPASSRDRTRKGIAQQH